MAEKSRASKAASKATAGFTDDEKAAMKEYLRERKARARGDDGNGEREVLDKIAQMQGSDRVLAKRIHELVRANAPELTPRTWYGMPAYSKDGDVVCFFQNSGKFKARYSTLGFSDEAKLDEGHMWPTTFALTELTPSDEAKIIALLKRAVG